MHFTFTVASHLMNSDRPTAATNSRRQAIELNTILEATPEVAHPNKKVDHEENVEGKIDLLRGAVRPFLARFHRLSAAYRHSNRLHEFPSEMHTDWVNARVAWAGLDRTFSLYRGLCCLT